MQKKPLSRYWLILGVTALAIAGLYSLVLAGGRSPKIGENALLNRIFHESLVVHVDLSVLVWFLSIACLMWSLLSANKRSLIPYIEEAALVCFAGGTFAITAAPFAPQGEALMSNYIPVIYNPIFFFGLMLIGCGTLLMVFRVIPAKAGILKALQDSRFRGNDMAIIDFALYGAAFITGIAFISFVWSYHQMPAIIEGQQYYDLLFWGGGHVLQFTHVQIVVVGWFLLVRALKPSFSVYPPHLMLLFSLALLGAFAAPFIYLSSNVADAAHRNGFTYVMILVNGIAPTIFALWVLPGLWSFRALGKGPNRALWSATIISMLLFMYGNVLGALIHGQNVVIPAHYHGSIVGITLAFMGVAYLLLPKLGYNDVANTRLAYWQPYIYGLGQFMHVTGFAWSGGYGALRKTPGGTYEGWQQIAMGLMGGGAGLAAIGGLMFVIVVARAVLSKKKN